MEWLISTTDANDNFGLFPSLLRFLGYLWPKNCSNQGIRPELALANSSKEGIFQKKIHKPKM